MLGFLSSLGWGLPEVFVKARNGRHGEMGRVVQPTSVGHFPKTDPVRDVGFCSRQYFLSGDPLTLSPLPSLSLGEGGTAMGGLSWGGV